MANPRRCAGQDHPTKSSARSHLAYRKRVDKASKCVVDVHVSKYIYPCAYKHMCDEMSSGQLIVEKRWCIPEVSSVDTHNKSRISVRIILILHRTSDNILMASYNG